MRHSELTKLRVDDVDLDDDVAIVTGKGPSAQDVPIRLEDRTGARSLPAGPLSASSGGAAAAVARRQRTGGDDRQRHRPDAPQAGEGERLVSAANGARPSAG
jgi:integrase